MVLLILAPSHGAIAVNIKTTTHKFPVDISYADKTSSNVLPIPNANTDSKINVNKSHIMPMNQ